MSRIIVSDSQNESLFVVKNFLTIAFDKLTGKYDLITEQGTYKTIDLEVSETGATFGKYAIRSSNAYGFWKNNIYVSNATLRELANYFSKNKMVALENYIKNGLTIDPILSMTFDQHLNFKVNDTLFSFDHNSLFFEHPQHNGNLYLTTGEKLVVIADDDTVYVSSDAPTIISTSSHTCIIAVQKLIKDNLHRVLKYYIQNETSKVNQ